MNDTEMMYERGFGQAVGFGVRPALLVVDFVNAFTDPSNPLGAAVDDEIEATNVLIGAARLLGAPVLFSSISYIGDQLEDAGVWARKIGGLSELRANSWAVAPDSRLHRHAQDSVLQKKYASCFFGTDLYEQMNRLGVDTLLVAGCSTSGCVRATVVDACQLGLRAIVAKEAVADRLISAHRQSLIDIQMKYGDVQPIAVIAAYLNALRLERLDHAART